MKPHQMFNILLYVVIICDSINEEIQIYVYLPERKWWEYSQVLGEEEEVGDCL